MCYPRLMVFAGLALATSLLSSPLAAVASDDVTNHARKFLDAHTAKLRPLQIAAAKGRWDWSNEQNDKDHFRMTDARRRIEEALADAEAFKEVKDLKEHRKDIDDKTIARCIDVLYLTYLEKQADTDLLNQMTAKWDKVAHAFYEFRPIVDGKEWDDSQVRQALWTSKDTKHLRQVWEASKRVGKLVEADLKDLVKLRNEHAKKLDFPNFHALQLYLNELDDKDLMKLFDELDELTREAFKSAKADIDARLAKKYAVKTTELMPWHYHELFFWELERFDYHELFFHKTPAVFDADLDAPYKSADTVKLTEDFYRGIGLPIDDVIHSYDLKIKGQNNREVFWTDIDRAGDVRVWEDVTRPTVYWMSTMLHQCGHSMYSSKTIPEDVPYVLRMESHTLTTEGVAMMFERLAYRRGWAEKIGLKLDDAKAFEATGNKELRYRLLIFSRLCQVMLRFEKGMYEDPEQDLNTLWWELVEKYENVKRPPDRNAPDYASSIQIGGSSVYFSNCMMGELFASQLHHAITKEVYKGADSNTVVYIGNKEVGTFMKKRVFEPGRKLSWNELTEHATGAKLNAKAFAADFKEK